MALTLSVLQGSFSALLLVLLAFLATGRFLGSSRLSDGGRPLPGPSPRPFVGSLLDLLSKPLWKRLAEWSVVYGPIYTYTVFNQRFLVLSNAQTASDILDRLSAKTSGKPWMIKTNRYLCRGMLFPWVGANELWRKHRRVVHESLNPRASLDFRPIQTSEPLSLLLGLLRHPEVPLYQHVYRLTASVTWRVVFGQQSVPLVGEDPTRFIGEFDRTMIDAALPGGSVVDLLPWLEPVITRVGWLRRKSDKLHEEASRFFIRAHTAPVVEGLPSLSGRVKETGDRFGVTSDYDSAWLEASIFLAAQDTTAAALKYFFLAMVCHPAAAKAPQQEIDDVLGGRAPTFDDWERLPWVEAVMKEVLRWRSVAPLAVPHAADEDILYEGYVIPKGTIIIANLWSISRVPTLYSNGDQFHPSHFLDSDWKLKPALQDTHDSPSAFGYGRRICPGKTVALNTLWITIAQLLWAFDFLKERDGEGKEVNVDDMNFVESGLRCSPAAFGMRLVPRFEDLEERLKSSEHRDVPRFGPDYEDQFSMVRSWSTDQDCNRTRTGCLADR